MRDLLTIAILILMASNFAFSGETDQFMVWGVELRDSSDAINRYLNAEIEKFLEQYGRADTDILTREQLVKRIYLYFFQGLHASKLRDWLQHSPEVDRFPGPEVSWWEYQNLSIYRGRSFPYLLPLSRTVRVGDVYCGIDKFAHFFGFGRRFFSRYLRLRDLGLSEQQAIERLVLEGIQWENSFVGKLVDGIFSHGDLEAAFQGAMLARDLCDERNGYFIRTERGWKLARPVDIRPYFTPEFDESYNPCHYWALRKRYVLPLLRAEYHDKAQLPSVRERFARYQLHPPSLSRQIINAYFDRQSPNPQKEQFFAAFGALPGLREGQPSATAQRHLTERTARTRRQWISTKEVSR